MAAIPARLLPALRQTCPPRLRGFTMLSRRGTWTDYPPPVVLSCCRGAGVDALRPSAPLCGLFCPSWYKYSPARLAPVLGGSAGL